MFRLLPLVAIVAFSTLIAASVTGKWIGSVETNGSRVPIWITLLQAGQEISGRVAIGAENSMPIEKAQIQEEQLTFEVHDSNNRIVSYRLALAPGLIRGEATIGDQVSKVILTLAPANPVYRFAGRLDTAPVLIRKVEPEYTEEARAAKIQGTVLVETDVEPNGRISDHVSIARSLGMGLDEKAIEAVKQWAFKPAYKDGKPVTATVRIEVNFRLWGGSLARGGLQPALARKSRAIQPAPCAPASCC